MSTKISEQLAEFINRARTQGKSDTEIRVLLINSGWDENIVNNALAPISDLVPPQPPAPKSSGREIFFYLLQFISLAIVATSLGRIIFAMIDKYLPIEVAPYYYSGDSGVTWPLASLIVVAPIFYLVTRALVRDVSAGRISAMSKIRRLLIYLALFLASATVIGDVIALVYRFLAGELNTRFVLKVLTILLIGGWVIFYYFITVKRDERKQTYPLNWHKIHGFVFGAVVLATIIIGFILTGSPIDRQKFVRDQKRVSDLQSIYYYVQEYYAVNNKMPESLKDIQKGYLDTMPVDPHTNMPYDYIFSKDTNFQLCANFETDDASFEEISKPRIIYGPYDVNWTHPSGRYCFTLDAKRAKS